MTQKITPLFLILLALVAGACSPMVATRGNMLEDFQLQQVKPGTSTREEVTRILGSPTTQDPFDANVWYYIGQKTKKKGIFDPRVVDEKIFRLTFDKETGILRELAPIDNQRNDIPIAADKTPTSGNEMTAVQQAIGNLGRFNTKKASPTDLGR
jgi:outer membrane protein assembly factor BamE (lipoprotein component of BamABCDE complex)